MTPTSARDTPTRWPSERATSSPSASAFSVRPDTSAMTAPTTMNGATWRAIVPSRPASEPTAQNRNWSSVLTSSSRIADVIDARNAVIAAPARASFTGVAPSRPSDPSA